MLHLDHVLNVLQEHRFLVNQKKCSFRSKEVEYLGHVISENGVAVDPKKIKSVVEWSTPHNVRGVMDFLGLTGYYRKFVKGYGKIAKPLTDLTKKEVFKRGPKLHMLLKS